MSILAADIDNAVEEKLLRDMFVELQSWRAIVANPNASWSSLATAIDAGGIVVGDADDRTVYATIEEDTSHANYIAAPRIVLRPFEPKAFQRDSTSGFITTAVIQATIDLTVDSSHLTNGLVSNFAAAYLDTRRKVEKLFSDLCSLARQSGRADIQDVRVTRAGLIDPKLNNGVGLMGVDATVTCRGAV